MTAFRLGLKGILVILCTCALGAELRVVNRVTSAEHIREDILVSVTAFVPDKLLQYAQSVLHRHPRRVVLVRFYTDRKDRLSGVNASHLPYQWLGELRRSAINGNGPFAEVLFIREEGVLRYRRPPEQPVVKVLGQRDPLALPSPLTPFRVILLQYHRSAIDERPEAREELDVFVVGPSLDGNIAAAVARQVRESLNLGPMNVFVGESDWFPYVASFPIYVPFVNGEPAPSEADYLRRPAFACYAFQRDGLCSVLR
jgi:hypothetical protein